MPGKEKGDTTGLGGRPGAGLPRQPEGDVEKEACQRGKAATSLGGVETHRIELDRTEDGVVIVAVEGEHDIYTTSALRENIDDALRDGVAVVIDLTEATFLDSSVLRTLVAGRNQAIEERIGFTVALDGARAPGVQRVLEVTGLLSIFPVLPGRVDAVQAARAATPTT